MSTILTHHIGLKKFNSLEEYVVSTGIATGNYKSNNSMDVDYIAPSDDQISCADYYSRSESDLVLQTNFYITSIEKNCHTLDSNRDYTFVITNTLPVSYDGYLQYSTDNVNFTSIQRISLPISASITLILSNRNYLDSGHWRILCDNGLKTNIFTTSFTAC